MAFLWLISTVLYLLKIKVGWNNDLWLFSGYLVLGYILYKKIPLNKYSVIISLALGIGALLATVLNVISNSVENNYYSVGFWLSYKTLNAALVASMLFFLARYYSDRLPVHLKKIISFISQCSLGIFILHPIFLWPVKAYKLE